MLQQGIGIYAFAVPVLLLVLLAIAEIAWPRRSLVLGRVARWRTHGLFFLTNLAIGRLLSLVVIVSVAALWAEQRQFGLFNQAKWHRLIEGVSAFILLDFAVWLQHWAMHRFSFLWRMHAVHHSDRDLDVTTALRFHPFELIVSTLYKSAIVAVLGVPLLVALAFELWLNANALFNHSNIRLPAWLDKPLRTVLVTPNMHLVHHSVSADDQRHNYGFAMSFWDRLFGTYRVQSPSGADHAIGLSGIQDERPASWSWSMRQPLT
jgi:sterol desaturase/sphingolipid hydroxylase (fatty acid hydroxylase superfamily)